MSSKINDDALIMKNASHPLSELLEDKDLQKAYFQQMRNAKCRGIEFLMSWEEWVMVWLVSGKLLKRGKKAGQYVMARFNDRGAYEITNVEIILATQNTSDGILGKPKSKSHRMKLRKILDEIRVSQPLTANGVYYESFADAGRAHNITYQGVRHRCSNVTNPSFIDWKVL